MGSVLKEISRLETAKQDIETAIEYCGVNVPDTELIDSYANYIRQIPSAVFSTLYADLVGGTDKFISSIKQTNGIIEATAGGLVSTSASGLAPKIGTAAAATITTATDEWALTSTKGATPTWRKLPVNAFENNNTTYTFTSGNGGFTVTPSVGTTQTVSIGNIDSSRVNALTNYSKATTISSIVNTDTLNVALGKLEYKADVVYNLIQGVYDGDGTIENLVEILKVLEGIKDTETIQAIVGKYLPLSGGVMKTSSGIYNESDQNGYGAIGFNFDHNAFGSLTFPTQLRSSSADVLLHVGLENSQYTLIHSGNISSQTVAAANKLSTARTIWGQSFDGSENVSGNIILGQGRIIFDSTLNHYIGLSGSTLIYNNAGGHEFYAGGASKFIINRSGNVGIGTTDPKAKLDVNGTAKISGDITASSFIKSDSSDSYVLLGGGGHKAISDFILKSDELTNNLIEIEKTLTVSKDWIDTGIIFDSTTFPTGTGSYMVQLSRDDTYYYTGYLSVIISSNVIEAKTDEIILHGGGFDMTAQYYLRTVQDADNKVIKLQIARSSTYSTSKTYTFKFKKLI